MKCILLCAGYATRLYPLTKDQPKPLLQIAEKAIIEHVVEKVSELDEVDTIYIVTNDKFYQHFIEWSEGYKQKMLKKIKILNDKTLSNDDRLGAIGDINYVINQEKIDDDVLIVLGDNLFEFGLTDIFTEFKNRQKTIVALYDVKQIEEAKKFGVVLTNEDMKIIHFEEKPQEPKSTLASIGIYFYPKSIVPKIQQYLDEGNNKDAPGNFPQWLHEREAVHGFVFNSETHKWFDIGSHESLKESDEHYKNKN